MLHKPFFENLLKPKPWPIVLALLTFPFLSLLSEHIINSYGSLAYSSSGDVQTYTSNRIREKTNLPAIFNVGGSGLLRALDEDYVLKKKFAGRYEFYNLAYSGQTFAESLMLLKTANIKKGDLVILHTSISRVNLIHPDNINICKPYIHSLYYNDMLTTLAPLELSNTETSNLCGLTLISKRSVIKQITLNMVSTLLRRDNLTFTGIYPLKLESNLKALNDERAEILNNQLGKRAAWFNDTWLVLNENSAKKSIEIIKKIDQHLKNIGAKLVIIDPPQNIEWFRKNHPYMDDLYEARYIELFSRLKSMGIGYYDQRKHDGFSYDDFYDHQHMIQSGRDKFFPIYKAVISKEMKSVNE